MNCCEQCGVEIPEEEDDGPCYGCGLPYCSDHHDPENHGPVDADTKRQGCTNWDFRVDSYGPKQEDI